MTHLLLPYSSYIHTIFSKYCREDIISSCFVFQFIIYIIFEKCGRVAHYNAVRFIFPYCLVELNVERNDMTTIVKLSCQKGVIT